MPIFRIFEKEFEARSTRSIDSVGLYKLLGHRFFIGFGWLPGSHQFDNIADPLISSNRSSRFGFQNYGYIFKRLKKG
jgi:hypothetical protein